MSRLQNYSAKLVCSALASVALCAPLPALACDTAAQAHRGSTCVVMPRRGVPGVWFDLDTADELRKVSLEVPELRLQMDAHVRIEGKRIVEVRNLRESIQHRKDVAKGLREAARLSAIDAKRARKETEEMKRKADSFLRKPLFWFLAGVATGGFAAAGVIVARE